MCSFHPPNLARQRYAIINGDDFGFSSGVNHAIIKAHTQGVLTSTSLMVTGDGFEEAVQLARTTPSLAVGLHLVLCCGKACLPPSQIPHLVDADGAFPNDPAIAGLRYQFNPAARQELFAEIRAQLEAFQRTELPLAHVDGHLHLHTHPIVLTHLVSLADEFNIRFIRLPSEELWMTLGLDRRNWLIKLVWSVVFGGLHAYGKRLLKSHGIQFAERVYGLLQTGRMTEDYLLELIPRIQANLVEIYSHPALSLPGEPSNSPLGLGTEEMEALLSERVRLLLQQSGFKLTNYNDQPFNLIC